MGDYGPTDRSSDPIEEPPLYTQATWTRSICALSYVVPYSPICIHGTSIRIIASL